MKIKNLFRILTLAVFFSVASTANAKVVYLAESGSDDNDGTTSQTAFATLAKAVEGIAVGDVIMIDGMIAVDATISLTDISNDGVQFVGANAETDGFDGGGKTRLFYITNSNVTFKNLNIRRGYFEGSPGGGAIYQTGGELVFEKCIINNNSTNYKSGSNGGAVRTQNTNVTLNNCELFYNSAFRGGALEVRGGNLTVDKSVFIYNYTNTINGAVVGGAAAGAICCVDVADTKITSSTIDSNKANGNAGALLFDGGSMEKVTILSCALTNNKSGGHGGMMMLNLNNKPELKVLVGGSTIAKNHNASAAAAVFVESTGTEGQSVSFVNCTITANETDNNVGNNGGIGMFDKKASLNIVNTILEGNWALGNNRYSDGWWKSTPVSVINSYVGYIYECNGEANRHYEEGYTIENSHWFTTLNGSYVMQSGISTEADCDGYCYPLYPGSEATTMGDVSLANSYGVTHDQKGNELTKSYIGAVQYVLGDAIPPQQLSTYFTTDIEDIAVSTSRKATFYELYNISGQKLGTYSHEPDLNGKRGTFILVEGGKDYNNAKKIIKN